MYSDMSTRMKRLVPEEVSAARGQLRLVHPRVRGMIEGAHRPPAVLSPACDLRIARDTAITASLADDAAWGVLHAGALPILPSSLEGGCPSSARRCTDVVLADGLRPLALALVPFALHRRRARGALLLSGDAAPNSAPPGACPLRTAPDLLADLLISGGGVSAMSRVREEASSMTSMALSAAAGR
jgi:hypothetical protein